jgi:hypothetical protein
MVKYSCEKCAKSFSQKSHYDKHISRKNPCEIQTDKIKALIDKAVDEKLIELNIKLKLNNTESNIIINITEQMDILKMSKIDLLEKCKELGITTCSSKNKPQLIELINSKNKTSNTEEYKNILISEDVINDAFFRAHCSAFYKQKEKCRIYKWSFPSPLCVPWDKRECEFSMPKIFSSTCLIFDCSVRKKNVYFV